MDEKNQEAEIPPKEIFEIMKINIYDNFYNYSFFAINKDYISSRKTLFSILHKITTKMGFRSQTFFLSVHFLDIIFSKKKRINSNLNTLGLACLCLAAKYCENDPIVPHLQSFIRIFNYCIGYKNIISMSDLMRTEVIALKLLNYKLNYFTIYDFNSFLFGHGILKIEQLKDLENKNKRYYRSRRKEFEINSSNSIMIKNILEKIYIKSRNYLDTIINNTKICFKYNPLIISIFIMKKSVEEILGKEQKINTCNKNEQEDFYSKCNLYFREIMLNFYKIDYETNEQYRELLADDEISDIFEKREKNEEGPAPLANKKINLKEDEKVKDNKIELDLNSNINIDEEIDNRSAFTSSVSNGFYNRLKLKANLEDLHKRHNFNERIVVNSRKENTYSDLNKIKNINESNDSNSINDNNDDLDSNLNINEIQNSIRKREIKGQNRWGAKYTSTKSTSSNNTFSKKEEPSLYSLSNNTYQNKYMISSNNRYIPNPDTYNSIKNSAIVHKTYLNNNSYNLTYTINANRGHKISLNKNTDTKIMKASPLKNLGNNINNNYNSFANRYSKIKGLNTGTERSDYSYNLLDKNNNALNTNIDSVKKRFDKRPYFRKLIIQNKKDNNNSNLESVNRNGFNSYFYSNNFNSEVNRNKNNNIYNNNNEYSSLNRNRIDINKKDSTCNTFYSRIGIRNRNENNIIDKSIDISKESNNNNIIDIREPKQITTTSSRYHRRYYNINNNRNNNTSNIIHNDISRDISNPISSIIKDSNKREIESYTQTNSNSNNNSFFHKMNINNIFKRKNRNYDVNSYNSNNANNTNSIIVNDKNNINDIIEDNKGSTTQHFYRNYTNMNKINISNSRASDNRNLDINKPSEPSRRISHILAKKNSELNNTLKEINKIRAKNEEQKFRYGINNNNSSRNIKEKVKDMTVKTINTVNTTNTENNLNNNEPKKTYQSIRQKYIEIKKNRNKNNNINNNSNINNSNNNINNNRNNNIIESNNSNINKNNKNISDFNKREYCSSTNINIGNNSYIGNINNGTRARYLMRNRNNKEENNNVNNNSNLNNNSNINNNNNNSNNNDNNNSLSTRVAEIESKNKYKNIAESSIFKLINKTRTLFSRRANKNEENSIRIEKKINNNNNNNMNNNNILNSTDINFFKTQQNYHKNSNKNEISENIQKDDKNKDNQQNTRYGASYLRGILNKNRINNDNPNTQSQKNSSTIVINNNININIENKNNNVNNEYIKYKTIYKKNNIPESNLNKNKINNNLNNNSNNNSNNNNNNSNILNRSNTNISMKTTNTSNTGSTFSTLFHRFPFYRKSIDKTNDNNNNNSNVGNSNGNNIKNERFQFFHRK